MWCECQFARTSLILLALCTVMSQAAEKRCDWHAEKAEAETPYKKCLDVSQFNGKTIEVPANVTRISRDGLSLCMQNLVKEGSADIVYLMDRSSSMSTKNACLSGGDTLFTERAPKHPVVGQASFPFKDGSRTLPVHSNCSGGGEYAGDPYGQRAIIIKEAIKLQQRLSQKATAGYAAFNSGHMMEYDQLPLEITKESAQAQPNIETLFKKIYLENSSELPLGKAAAGNAIMATGWAGALGQAKVWLNPDNGHTVSGNQAIVMVSDGRPSDWFTVELLMDSANVLFPGKMPPVYGIHLGNTDPGDPIKDIATLTGGQWYMVPPKDTDSLHRVMSSIIGTILKSTTPKSATLRNLDNGQQSNADASTFSENPDGSWSVTLGELVALKEGANRIEIEASFNDAKTGRDTVLGLSFTLDVKGSETSEDGKFVTCYENSTLEARNTQGKPLTYFSRQHAQYGLSLRTLLGASPQSASGVSREMGDSEKLMLTSIAQDGDYSIHSGTFPFAISDASLKGKEDGTLESKRADAVTFSWTHPRDPRDRAALVLEVRDARASVSGAAYFDDDADGYLDRFAVVFGTEVPVNRDLVASHPELFKLKDGLALDRAEWRGDSLMLWVKDHEQYNSGDLPITILEDASIREEGQMEAETVSAKDRVAPVALSARFRPEVPEEGILREGGNDTLWVTFSEASLLVGDAARPFRLEYRENGKEYVFELRLLEMKGEVASFQVKAIEGVIYPGNGDWLWLQPGTVQDANGNIQRATNNRRARLDVAPPPGFQKIRPLAPIARLDLQTEPGPADGFAVVRAPDAATEPIRYLTGGEIPTMDKDLLDAGDGESVFTGIILEASRAFTAQVILYDNLGSFVHKVSLEVSPEAFAALPPGDQPGARALSLAWTGNSTDGSTAGTGAYIFKATISLAPMGGQPVETGTSLFMVGLVR